MFHSELSYFFFLHFFFSTVCGHQGGLQQQQQQQLEGVGLKQLPLAMCSRALTAQHLEVGSHGISPSSPTTNQ